LGLHSDAGIIKDGSSKKDLKKKEASFISAAR
jgi:hypothetical protein